MGNEARMLLEPSAHVRMLVGAVIVHHQVQPHLAGEFLIQTAQEFQELLVAVPREALSDDPALEMEDPG